MSVLGTPRTLRYRMPAPADDEPLPESGDFLRVATTGTTYRIGTADMVRDSVEPWRSTPDDPADGFEMRVLHFRLRVVRIPPEERPDDAMTWDMVWDRPRPQASVTT